MNRYFNFLLLFFIFSFSFVHLKASHNAGGSIKYKSLGSNRYYVEAAIFRDCSGSQLSSTTQVITAKCSSSSSSTNYTLNHLPFVSPIPILYRGPYSPITISISSTVLSVEEISDVCNKVLNPQKSPSTRCRSTFNTVQGFTRYIYSGIITLSSCNYWTLGMITPPRNIANANISSSSVYVETKFNNSSYPLNSSPYFGDEKRPIFNACVGQIGEYQFGSNDPDEDSLTYKLVCVGQFSGGCANYRSGFSSSIPVAGAKLDSITGRFQFKPTASGKRMIGVLVSEYNRCTGAWIGSTLRDVTIWVRACSNKYPQYTHGISKVTGSVTKLDSFKLKVKAGKTFSLEDTLFDPDLTDTLVLFSNKDFFPGSTIQTNRISKNKLVFRFSWTPPSYTKGMKVLHLTLSDDRCDYPAKRRIAYHLDFTPTISISISGLSKADTILLMKGDTLDLGSGGNGKVTWSVLAGDSIRWVGSNKNIWGDTVGTDTNSKVSFRPLISTLLKATGKINSICKGLYSSDSIYIKIIPTFQIKTSKDTIVCSGLDSVQISVTPDSSYSYTYLWSSSGGKISNTRIFNPYVTAAKSGIYMVKVTSNFGGERVASVHIGNIPDLPPHDLISSVDSMCVGGSIKLQAKIKRTANFCSLGPKMKGTTNIDSYDSLNVFNATSGTWAYPNPLAFNNLSAKQEFLYHAKSLTNQGLKRGIIQSIGFYIDSAQSSSGTKLLTGYNIKLGCTSDSAVNSWTMTGLSGVVSNKNVTLNYGWNVIQFDSGYYWDGHSNLRVQLCYGHSMNTQIKVATAMQSISYNGSLSQYGATSVCSSQMLSIAKINHIPVIRFGITPSLDTSDIKYTWFPTSSFTSSSKYNAFASPRSTTTYSVAISDTFSVCRDTLSKTIVIVPLQLNAGNDTSICNGVNYTFNPTVKPNNNGNYTWFPASLFSNNKVKNPSLRVFSNNTIWVSYVDSLGCSETDTILVSSKANPDPNFSTKLKFCETETINLLVANTSGGVFIGPGVTGTNFNAADPSNKPGLNSPKSISIFHRVTTNGCTSDTTIIVEVFPIFDTVYSGKTTFCQSDTLEPLKTRHSGGVWIGNGVLNSTFNPTVAGKGTHTIKVDSSGFCGNSAVYSFIVFEDPDHDFPDTVYGCNRKPVLLDAGNPGSTYLWNTGATSQTLKPTKSGKYWVNIVNGNLCEITDSTIVKISEICLGLNSTRNASNEVNIFPNPADHILNIKSTNLIDHVTLLSLSGQTIKSFDVYSNEAVLDVSKISNGSYFLQVSTNDVVQSYRILIR